MLERGIIFHRKAKRPVERRGRPRGRGGASISLAFGYVDLETTSSRIHRRAFIPEISRVLLASRLLDSFRSGCSIRPSSSSQRSPFLPPPFSFHIFHLYLLASLPSPSWFLTSHFFAYPWVHCEPSASSTRNGPGFLGELQPGSKLNARSYRDRKRVLTRPATKGT